MRSFFFLEWGQEIVRGVKFVVVIGSSRAPTPKESMCFCKVKDVNKIALGW